jgi:hypothetical protein
MSKSADEAGLTARFLGDTWIMEVEERLASLEYRLDALVDRLALVTVGLHVERDHDLPPHLRPPTSPNDELPF